jgi:hypothetical protein
MDEVEEAVAADTGSDQAADQADELRAQAGHVATSGTPEAEQRPAQQRLERADALPALEVR